jgi:hypothetical protein
MIGIRIPARAIVVPAALVALGVAIDLRPRAHAAPIAITWPLLAVPAPVIESVTASAAPAPAEAPAIDLVRELHAIGERAATRWRAPPAVGAACARPSLAERKALKRRVAAWIDHEHPDERLEMMEADDNAYVFGTGCVNPAGFFVDASMDRVTTRGDRGADGHEQGVSTRRNYVLRVSDTIEVIAERTSTPSKSWMEWADEGRLAIVAEVDLDGDGTRDLVWSDHQHEGGSITSEDELSVLYATGTRASIATVTGLADIAVVNGTLVLGMQAQNDPHMFYRCVGGDLQLAPCAASAARQRVADRAATATWYADFLPDQLPDRDRLAADLALLDIPAADRTRLVAAAHETSPDRLAQRHVAAFLSAAHLVDNAQALIDQPHPAAQAFFARLASQLGDSACARAPLTKTMLARITRWIGMQNKQTVAVDVEPECGAYAWAAWDDEHLTRHEVLLALDGTGPRRVLGFTYTGEGGASSSRLAHGGAFFRHGTTVVGTVTFEDKVWAVANGAVVGTRHGEHQRYGYDRSWLHDASDDVLVDARTRALWHATPTGFERLDDEPVRTHEARRTAIERLLDDPAGHDPAYLAALRTLGADPALVAECEVLAP